MWMLFIMSLLCGAWLGWEVCALRRAWIITTHQRCPLCEGEGCINDVTRDFQAARTVGNDPAVPPGNWGVEITPQSAAKDGGAES
jgi:hypothetical protein